ncbi:alpha/beta fold hydrolase [Bradyrhizobium diazoefficiens]|nr:alpha/beta hydrolase [Bradyrhizobium diazoefficiens]QQO19131.1 alpha/beta fold hydrolase [Bradyrhizobium diazoefficiens]
MTNGTVDEAIDRIKATQPPVVFIHGLWLRPSSWDRWVEMFQAAGYAALAPAWPAQVGGAAAPETIGEVVAHFARIAEAQSRRPAIIGHSFGGLIAQALAGHGLSAATVAIDPAPLRGVLPMAAANLNPWIEARLNTEAAQRGPLLVISGERDNTVQTSAARAAYEQQKRNGEAITEFVQLPGRDHSLTIDRGWREVAETALTFVRRFY